MAMDQHYLQQAVPQNDSKGDGATIEKWKSSPATVDESENNPCGGFDCNICLDSVQDPVVTLCGHLYCWPCIYKWIHFQSASSGKLDHQNPQCPVCKAEVSQKTLVPLYGRSQTAKPSEGKTPHLGIVVPQRPRSPSCRVQTSSRPAQQLHHHHSYPQRSLQLQPGAGMYGEMVYARIFGNSETTLYAYPNSYLLSESSSPRLRRHMMRTEESLSRVCFFLLCCVVLCLLLF
ncbi:hypothetical protein RHGRI_017718 [Rhododendron griersonianum]|uniref:E3 ubiquitin-protein ligase RMA n=1 Tax=Rhododendron griersonianum TaxID=479676 RepID=A0AAV6JZ27_9ERIC|nr:hypothetical protein RHGRI_017718 [Rhododendron griersonianum]